MSVLFGISFVSLMSVLRCTLLWKAFPVGGALSSARLLWLLLIRILVQSSLFQWSVFSYVLMSPVRASIKSVSGLCCR